MADHLSDEEQLENLKRWWRENGLQSVLIVVLAVGGWYGWQFWQDQRQALAEQASVLYQQLMDAETQAESGGYIAEQRADIEHLAATLKEVQSGGQYGRYAALLLARLAVQDNDLETAARELRWVLERAEDDGLEQLARLRLARVENARGNYEEALRLLDIDAASPLAAAFAEIRGDILLRQGSNTAARMAYEKALATLLPEDVATRSIIELKLGQVPGPDIPAAQDAAGDI